MSSKYDVVKVKVYLSESNYYVLSRYLLTKVLTFCKVPTSDAIRMSLEVKRYLVNAGMIQITPQVLYERIQTTMEAHGYGQSHAIYFPIITKIHQERIPIIVFVTGWGPCGKTRLARSLASCLNCNCVVNTEVLLTIEASARTLPATTSSSSHLTTSIQPDSTLGWLDQCRLVQSFVEDECKRSLDGGKLLIVEGTALNLSLYASYFTEDFAKENRAVVLAFLLKTSCEKDPLQHPVLQAEWSDRAPPAEVVEAHKDFCEQASSMCIHSTSDSARSARELDTAVYEFELSSTFAVADVATSMHNIVVARVLRQLASEEDGAG